MELWSWLVVVLLYGLGFSSALVRPRRQSETWWRSQQHGWESSRTLGHSAPGLGSPRANSWSQTRPVSGLGAPRALLPIFGFGAPRALQPVSGQGSRYPAGQYQPRQLLPPTPSPSSPISVQCGEDRMVVMVNRDFYGNGVLVKPSDLSLGSCSPGSQGTDTMVVFDNDVQACRSSLQVTQDFLIYRAVLVYNPVSSNTVILRSTPAVVPILCYYPRHGNVSSDAIRPTWAPFSTTVSTEERLAFSMYLMTDDWSSRRSSLIFQLGDVFHIEASVETDNHIPMTLFVDYCVATPTSDINSTPNYDIIAYNGCLVDGTQDDSSSAFRSPRSQPNKIQFTVDAFWFIETDASMIYMTCSLRAVDANQPPDPMNKACSYNKATRSWSAVEGFDNICSCCEAKNCAAPLGQSRRWGTVYGGSRHIGKRETGLHLEKRAMATLGPLLVIGAEKHYVESTAERAQASRLPEGSQPLALWMVVVIGAVSIVVVTVALFVLGGFIRSQLLPQEAQK